ncbi:SE1561 family protein [Bacillus sp. HMF5848]|uniref:SE1561 family protein n=1 Tax=Bacillus sp. HMF5848 TaxID=2495421 RepID=UPI00163AAE4A|nr:SE1561 family protein [Bacillus sp. HMF5848]
MGNAIDDKGQQVEYLKQRLNMFLNVLDSLEPENTELEDIDRLINLMEDLEVKINQYKK